MNEAAERRRKRRGRRGETAAAIVLRLRGLRVLGRNVRVRGGAEVDVLARSGRTLVLVEVKARGRRAGEAAEAVDVRRRDALRRGAEALLADPSNAWAEAVRFDVVAIDGLRLRHLRDAF